MCYPSRILVCITAVVCSGCATVNDYNYILTNKARSVAAWHGCHSFSERWHLSSHYAYGWRKGYYDVSTGGCGEPPAVPPHVYWSPWYQNDRGQMAVNDWYAGYQDGATAAQSAGNEYWHPIPTGPTIPTDPVMMEMGVPGEYWPDSPPAQQVPPMEPVESVPMETLPMQTTSASPTPAQGVPPLDYKTYSVLRPRSNDPLSSAVSEPPAQFDFLTGLPAPPIPDICPLPVEGQSWVGPEAVASFGLTPLPSTTLGPGVSASTPAPTLTKPSQPAPPSPSERTAPVARIAARPAEVGVPQGYGAKSPTGDSADSKAEVLVPPVVTVE